MKFLLFQGDIVGLKEDKASVEAALFVSGDPVSLREIKNTVDIKSTDYVEKLIDLLKKEYRERNSSIEIENVLGDKYVMQVKEEYSEKVMELAPGPDLTKGELRTLAVIAYKQPIMQSKLKKLRGSHSYEHVKKLLRTGLISANPQGRSKELRTTHKFAKLYGLENPDPETIKEKFSTLLEKDLNQ